MSFKKVAIVNLMRSLGSHFHQIVFAKYSQDQGSNTKIDNYWYNFSKLSDRTIKRKLASN
jgi:hypothetical protein